MKKGTRVEILPPHPNEGTQGFVFWTGPDKFDEQAFRLGVKDAEGEAIWISSNGVKVLDASGAEEAGSGAPRPAPRPVDPNAPAPERGSRVQWASGTGKVFWYGPSKFGEGMRIGAEDDSGEKHWLEAHEVTVLTAAPSGGGGGGGGGGYAPRSNSAPRTPAQPSWDDGDPGPSDRDAWVGDDADIPF